MEKINLKKANFNSRKRRIQKANKLSGADFFSKAELLSMANWFKRRCFLLCTFAILFFSCTTLPSFQSVYSITQGQKSSEGIDSDGDLLYDFYFTNNSPDEIESVEITLSLFNCDGESVFINDFETFIITGQIAANEERYIVLDLSDLIFPEETDTYITDYLYASKITYKDAPVWEDKFGLWGM